MFIGKRVLILLAVGSVPLLGAITAGAEIYKWVDEQGQVHFQDHPPQGAGRNTDVEVRDSSPIRPGNLTPAPGGAAGIPGQSVATGTPVAPAIAPPRISHAELYIVDWCPWCKKARMFLNGQGVVITEYDIEKDLAALARKNELDPEKGVPFAIINGVKVHGFSEQAYTRAIKTLPAGNP